ncbi:molybdopterin-guanine dinucleotide biosynthesis protein B [Halalkalibacter okhensis]|uniref:Molybdopterin-guanine dinucleotide biosynthesis protein B (MobB) domain-containing protein n=1 Tax=Halalkalibacter okhensis TaxID=333138 RepID=A0A0B0IDH3_9BACI|nr:molybdopterin-guanine dinucleotide biosynthesis protein B [Halalkalibacter okhensis]KHF39330.1 hypothetical protein LQ50_15675 [Halalkalibacter okhensis]
MALEQYCPILQVVGYQNSGKTTLMEALIKRCSESGLQVATIKHHGHTSPQRNESKLKDSERHMEAGADMTAVEGGGSLQLHIKNQTWSLEKMVKLYETFSPDILLVEGFKKEPYPKVVILRSEKDVDLLRASNIVCAITWKSLPDDQQDFPIFHVNDTPKSIEYILQKLSDEHESTI